MKETLAIIAAILAFVGNISYLKDVFKDRIKPHPYTWLIWSIVSLVTFFGQWQKGAGFATLPTGVAEAFTIIIFLYSLKRLFSDKPGEKFRHIRRIDNYFLIIALLGLIPWALTNDPTISVITVVCIDVLAFVPTLRKAWNHPDTERPTLYEMNVARHVLTLFSLNAYNIATTLHSIAMICTNSLMTRFIIRKRSTAEKILTSIEPVIRKAQHVSINHEAILNFIKDVDIQELNNADIKGDKELNSDSTTEERIAYAVINGALQFCFWGDPKWTIEIDGLKYDGGEALIRSIKRGIDDGYNLLNPEYLSTITDDDVANIFRGAPEIPLLKERTKILKALGDYVIKFCDGKFENIVINSGGDVNIMLDHLVTNLPEAFDDTANYRGHKVHFYKRVQILVTYIHQLSVMKKIPYVIKGKEGLAGLADYRAPQILRHLGILKYDEYLSNIVDNKIEIIEGSDEEIEIRAYTLYAEHEVALALKNSIPEINDALAHKILWFRCQKMAFDKPYHRTHTVWY